MEKNEFSLKKMLKANRITAKEVAEKTGYNKNTITNWAKLDSDETIPLGFIYKLQSEFPNIIISPYFPTYSEIIKSKC